MKGKSPSSFRYAFQCKSSGTGTATHQFELPRNTRYCRSNEIPREARRDDSRIVTKVQQQLHLGDGKKKRGGGTIGLGNATLPKEPRIHRLLYTTGGDESFALPCSDERNLP